jgi:hypothetical protein
MPRWTRLIYLAYLRRARTMARAAAKHWAAEAEDAEYLRDLSEREARDLDARIARHETALASGTHRPRRLAA